MRTSAERMDYRWINMKRPGPREVSEDKELAALTELPTTAVAFVV